MILVNRQGDIVNFDNVEMISQHGPNIIAHMTSKDSVTLITFSKVDEARTALLSIQESLIKNGHARITFT